MIPCTPLCPQGDCAGCAFPPRAAGVAPIACTGGWCSVRQSCLRYHTDTWVEPAEHLCTHGTHDCWASITAKPEHVTEHHTLALIQGAAAERIRCA